MPSDKKMRISSHIRGIIAVTLIGTAIAFSMSDPSNYTWRHLGINLFYCFLIGFSLWFGNVSIDPILERVYGKKKLSPGWKLILSIISMLLMSSAIILFVNWLWAVVIWGGDFESFLAGSGRLIMIIELVVVVIIALVMFTNGYFNFWREAVKSEEALKREKLALEYETLKNQVNPHFLFNSLNSLSGLIGQDDEKATRFVKQLSDIYRYVLEHKGRELVNLDTEMRFVENFISLMKIRFGDNLNFVSELDSTSGFKVIPLSVQMLVENAIKHNIVAKDKPLTISISISSDHHLEVRNNLQKKSSIMESEAGDWEKHGLANLKSRYEYLSDARFEVNGSSLEPFPEELDGYFVVKVPMIH
jgi:hypothetical protein